MSEDKAHELMALNDPLTLFLTGPGLISDLANKYIDEAVGLIDGYVDRVISKTKSSIGQCGPVSASYNATVDALCKAQRITFEFGGLFLTLKVKLCENP